ncbi:RHS repeat protein [Marinimicrobium alkaliphilum]|uniref:RHS repeat protein n=1 Tax=Marinimicrobium alkaliphilum TaxID=2202654 RepID=UPI000DBA6A25|nr:RHS repeat domain-containing protein [Marinimicrobium alkaliphilum]
MKSRKRMGLGRFLAAIVMVLLAGQTSALTVPANSSDVSFTISLPSTSGHYSTWQVEQKRGVSGNWTSLGTRSPGSHTITVSASGDYYYRARGYNPRFSMHGSPPGPIYGNWVERGPVRVNLLVAPGRPSYVAGSDGTTSNNGSYNVNWGTGSGDVDYYRWRENNGSWRNTGTTRNTGTLNRSNGSYTYNVQACNSVGCSSSRSVTITVNIPPPGVPSSISSSVGSNSYDGSYRISWGTSSGNVGHYRWRENGGSWQNTGTGRNTPMLTRNNGTYTYNVQACNSIGCSSSRSMTVVVNRDVNPTISRSTATSNNGNYSLSWTAGQISGKSGEAVWVHESGTSTPILVYGRNSSGSIVANTNPLTRSKTNDGSWTYSVTSCVNTGFITQGTAPAYGTGTCKTSSSTTVTVARPPGIPSSISSSDGSNSYSGSYTISWGASSGNVGHYRWRENGGSWQNMGTNRNTSTLTRNDGTYTYNVQACNSIGCSSSRSMTVTVERNIPPTIDSSVETSTSGNFNLTWTAGKINGRTGTAVWIVESGTPVLVLGNGSQPVNVNPLARSKDSSGSWAYYVLSCVGSTFVTQGTVPVYNSGTCEASNSITVTVDATPPIDYSAPSYGSPFPPDADGDMDEFEYDALGRLRKVRLSDGNEIRYHYDKAGNRRLVEGAE